MKELLRSQREQFLRDVTTLIGATGLHSVVLTHLLPDRPELLRAIDSIAPIRLVIGIPYSNDPETVSSIREEFPVVTPTLKELTSPQKMEQLITQIGGLGRFYIAEIGGYFSESIQSLALRFGNRLAGVIEDTEVGHRKYMTLPHLPCPVVSIARSTLKTPEDLLVGSSCVFSVERLLRELGLLLEPRPCLVLGYGKVGRGLAQVLSRRRCIVMVYDTDPIKRLEALSEGCLVPDREDALARASIVFGATGTMSLTATDYDALAEGTILVSCSSKNIEFDLQALTLSHTKFDITRDFTAFKKDGRTLFLMAEGHPVNFLDGAIIGPIISAVQAELLMAVAMLDVAGLTNELCEVSEAKRRMIAEVWLNHFGDSRLGSYLGA